MKHFSQTIEWTLLPLNNISNFSVIDFGQVLDSAEDLENISLPTGLAYSVEGFALHNKPATGLMTVAGSNYMLDIR